MSRLLHEKVKKEDDRKKQKNIELWSDDKYMKILVWNIMWWENR